MHNRNHMQTNPNTTGNLNKTEPPNKNMRHIIISYTQGTNTQSNVTG